MIKNVAITIPPFDARASRSKSPPNAATTGLLCLAWLHTTHTMVLTVWFTKEHTVCTNSLTAAENPACGTTKSTVSMPLDGRFAGSAGMWCRQSSRGAAAISVGQTFC